MNYCNCKYYNKEFDCCAAKSDWSDPMTLLQPCIEGPCDMFKANTNYEAIKRMSVEELAELIDSFRACNNCMKNGSSCFPRFNTMEWLEREVEE